jgi:hypothetical protein
MIPSGLLVVGLRITPAADWWKILLTVASFGKRKQDTTIDGVAAPHRGPGGHGEDLDPYWPKKAGCPFLRQGQEGLSMQ